MDFLGLGLGLGGSGIALFVLKKIPNVVGGALRGLIKGLRSDNK